MNLDNILSTAQLDLSKAIYNCTTEFYMQGEHFIEKHIFCYVVSGTTEVVTGKDKYVFHKGDFMFIRRNQIVRYTHLPDKTDFNAICIYLDETVLRRFFAGRPVMTIKETDRLVVALTPSAHLQTYAASLSPYPGSKTLSNLQLTQLKMQELLYLLLELQPDLEGLLSDFSAPGKIDLEAHMNQHYRTNISLSQFAYLTGRSLATFKRDFKQVFNTTPSQWLLQKRLNDAHCLITRMDARARDIYRELGFKSLSHFNHAYKRSFDMTPAKGRGKMIEPLK